MRASDPRYRLRISTKIVGYMRKIGESMTVFSRDGSWWTGYEIGFKEIDEWTGFQDKNNQFIYEWDIVLYKLDPDDGYLKGVILWEENAKEFGICDIEEKSFIPLQVNGVNMFSKNQLEVFSYLFLNPDLQRRLGARDD
ncbi:hypothetical protein [Owenweeksia hongkongensis]|uniref:hypothetical protein n=1 Tax=Owenweeksia hongkongensis TaxID=253245 RepID=UPI003A948061